MTCLADHWQNQALFKVKKIKRWLFFLYRSHHARLSIKKDRKHEQIPPKIGLSRSGVVLWRRRRTNHFNRSEYGASILLWKLILTNESARCDHSSVSLLSDPFLYVRCFTTLYVIYARKCTSVYYFFSRARLLHSVIHSILVHRTELTWCLFALATSTPASLMSGR